MNWLSLSGFKATLNLAIDQVAAGKGEERHGHGVPLESQPWVSIMDTVGAGFPLGQAVKKIMELRTFDPGTQYAAWEREVIGAIVYLCFAVMWHKDKYDVVNNDRHGQMGFQGSVYIPIYTGIAPKESRGPQDWP